MGYDTEYDGDMDIGEEIDINIRILFVDIDVLFLRISTCFN